MLKEYIVACNIHIANCINRVCSCPSLDLHDSFMCVHSRGVTVVGGLKKSSQRRL